MLRIALIYGAISGSIVIAVMIIGFTLTMPNEDYSGGGASQLFGYSVMLVALSMIFIGIKQYRDRELGGVIKFGQAFLTGVFIAAIAGLFYIIGWEIYLAATDHAFINQYTDGIINRKRIAGATEAELQTLIADMEVMKARYANPVYRLPMTFIEIFPVGFLIAVLSAAILRNPRAFPARG